MKRKAHSSPHKYGRVLWDKKEVMRCFTPDCAHWVSMQMAVGKISSCWAHDCGNQVLFSTKKDLKVKPTCSEHTKKMPKRINTEEIVDDILEDVGLGHLK